MSEIEVPRRPYFTMAAASRVIGAPPTTLRKWEAEFGMKVRKGPNGQKIYTRTQVMIFAEVSRLGRRGMRHLTNTGLADRLRQIAQDSKTATTAAKMSEHVSEVVALAESIAALGRDLRERAEEMPRVMHAGMSAKERAQIFRGKRHMEAMRESMRAFLTLVVEGLDGRR